MLSYTVGIEECLRNIFAGVLVGGLRKDNPIAKEKIREAKICLARFSANFPSNIFQNEYAVYYDIIVNLKAKVFTKGQLGEIIDNNREIVLNSPYVDLSGYDNR